MGTSKNYRQCHCETRAWEKSLAKKSDDDTGRRHCDCEVVTELVEVHEAGSNPETSDSIWIASYLAMTEKVNLLHNNSAVS